jgi:TrmH family RNA methyltransferase
MSVFENLTVVLVDPRYGGNVGSVARVMANFGIRDLRLVRPAPEIFTDPMLEPMARESALPILRQARTFKTLTDALEDVEIALGFSTRSGKKRRDSLALREAVQRLAEEAPAARIGAVFGSEDKGLSNEDLEKCHWLARIPTAPELSSLNLSQAVSLFAYEAHVMRLSKTQSGETTRNVASVTTMEGFYQHLEKVLLRIGFIEESSPARMMNQMRRMFSRRLPDSRDVQILRGVLAKIELSLERATKGLDR